MIINFKCKNFYSIGEEVAVDFEVDGNAPNTQLYKNISGTNTKVSLIETAIGPNASGKTTLLKVPAFLKHLITTSLNDPIGKLLPFEPHKNHTEEPSEISVKFSINSKIFEYLFKLTKERILSEKLLEFSKTEERFTSKTLFFREWDDDKKSYALKDNILNMTIDQLRENASIISVAKQLPNNVFARDLAQYWLDDVVIYNLWMHGHREGAMDGGGIITPEINHLFLNPHLKDRVSDILKRYDIGFNDFIRKEVKTIGDSVFSYGLEHRYDNAAFNISLSDESSGTKRLIAILTHIVQAMTNHDGIAIIDELDAFLHPDIVEAIVDLFIDENTNTGGTQLLFSTHNHRVLTFLDKQQIILSEKNAKGESEVWRLDDMQGVRADDNYYTKYTAGAYSAKPRID